MSLDYIESVIGINTTGTEGSLLRFFRKFRFKGNIVSYSKINVLPTSIVD